MAQRDKLIPLLKDLRELASKQKGFVSRFTYSNLNDPGEYIISSEWDTADNWIEWRGLTGGQKGAEGDRFSESREDFDQSCS